MIGVIVSALFACGDATYAFLGRRYAAERDCLETTTSIDVLSGSDPGNCEARCVSAPVLADGGGDGAPIDGGTEARRDTFVTTMCPPLPHGITPTEDTHCVRALAALARKDTCLRDGGSSAPSPSR